VTKLNDLRNVGPATLADFALLDIKSVEQLSTCDPDILFAELQTLSGQRQDPCVWDVFAATIHQARTGEIKNWWDFTAIRKARIASGAWQRP
jgi:Pathogenicity locus